MDWIGLYSCRNNVLYTVLAGFHINSALAHILVDAVVSSHIATPRYFMIGLYMLLFSRLTTTDVDTRSNDDRQS